MRTVIAHITQTDIASHSHKSCDCPMARAIRRALDLQGVEYSQIMVHRAGIYMHRENGSFFRLINQSAKDWVFDYDCNESWVRPRTYIFDVVESH